jgi:hypothetical protein
MQQETTFPRIMLIETNAEREQVFKLRYKVYIEEMGKTSHYADSIKRSIRALLHGLCRGCPSKIYFGQRKANGSKRI